VFTADVGLPPHSYQPQLRIDHAKRLLLAGRAAGFFDASHFTRHFKRAVGQAVRVKTETGRARGEVVSAGEKTVQIENGNGPVEISYDEIVRANLIDEGTKG